MDFQKFKDLVLDDQLLGYFAKKMEMPGDKVEVIVDEFLKYMLLADAKGEGSVPISQEVDDIWHFWILETSRYFQLCSVLPDGSYVHHTSEDYQSLTPDAEPLPAPTLVEDVDEGFVEEPGEMLEEEPMLWLASYVANFGGFSKMALEFWPYAASLFKQSGHSLEEFNERLAAI